VIILTTYLVKEGSFYKIKYNLINLLND